MNYKDIILQFAFKDNKVNKSFTCKLSKNAKRYCNIISFIMTYYDDYSESIREGLYRLKYNIKEIPCCPICGKKLKFIGKNGKIYLTHCSNRCKRLDKDVQEKSLVTCKEKYGDGNLTNRTKAKETCKEKYGVENPFQIDSVKEKIQESNKEYFNKGITQEKIRNTVLAKYGVEYYLQSDDAKNKRVKTSLEKYGVRYPIQSKEVKNKYNWEEINSKIYNTKKVNNSFVSSSIEQQLKKWLDEENISYEYQYKSDKYPFNCDFYLSDYDLYIEIQGNWTHGGKPFENNVEDNNKLKVWEFKKNKYYKNAIKTWTISDVKKRNIAKENGLNYLEIFSIDFKVCISMIKNILIG